MKSGIYKIVSTVNGKQYVGSAMNLNRRKITHWSKLRNGTHVNSCLQNAWNKYGEDTFEFRLVGKCPPERLIELEQEVMDHLKPEYNISLTAGSILGIKFSAETRRKMSESSLGKPKSEAHRRKISEARIGDKNPNWGKTCSLETRQKLSAAGKGRKFSEETRRKISVALIGNTLCLGHKHSMEARLKMSEAKLGKPKSEAHRRKLSEASKAWWARKKSGLE